MLEKHGWALPAAPQCWPLMTCFVKFLYVFSTTGPGTIRCTLKEDRMCVHEASAEGVSQALEAAGDGNAGALQKSTASFSPRASRKQELQPCSQYSLCECGSRVFLRAGRQPERTSSRKLSRAIELQAGRWFRLRYPATRSWCSLAVFSEGDRENSETIKHRSVPPCSGSHLEGRETRWSHRPGTELQTASGQARARHSCFPVCC